MASEWIECNNGLKMLRARVPDSRPPEVRKMLGYANTLRGLLKEKFLKCLKNWALSSDDIENLLCVMQRYPKYAINDQQMKWLEEYKGNLVNTPKGGKPQHKFVDIILYQNKEELLQRLHNLIDGRGGADVGAILLRAKLDGYICRTPKQEEFKEEFTLIGSWQAISNYFNEDSNRNLGKASNIIIFDKMPK